MQGRSKKGTFTHKSSSDRQVKSIRATEETWNKFGEQAKNLGITRADLLEKTFSSDGVIHGDAKLNDDKVIRGEMLEIIGILRHGITPKKNGGTYASNNAKSLKEEVIKAIALLEDLIQPSGEAQDYVLDGEPNFADMLEESFDAIDRKHGIKK